MNRRRFLKSGLTASVAPLAGGLSQLDATLAAAESESTGVVVELPQRLAADESPVPWQQKIRRVGQTNFTEYDPAVMNVDQWADYWHAVKADIVYVSVTGILAFYPSKVKFHRHGKFLKDRDLFGECVAAAKKRGMRVVARMSPDLNWEDCLESHPDWFERHADGSPNRSREEPRLIRTCMF